MSVPRCVFSKNSWSRENHRVTESWDRGVVESWSNFSCALNNAKKGIMRNL